MSDDLLQESPASDDTLRCPFCHQQTPQGAYCAHCGRSLSAPPPPLDEDDDDTLVDDVPVTSPPPNPAEKPPIATAILVETIEDDEDENRFENAGKKLKFGLSRAFTLGGNDEDDPLYNAIGRRERRPLSDYRRIVAIALFAVLIALLLNNAGIAILLAVFVVPALALLYLTDLDLFEREPWSAILAALGAGFALGLLFGTISAWLTGRLWIEGASFYAGAAGFGARFAEAEGTPPFSWIFLGGIVIPAVVVIACAVAPVMMRRWPTLRNEVMDGLTLGAASGGGYAAATTIVHFWPAILRDQNPGGDISDWTATLTGLIVVRPLIFAGFSALLCASIWQYALDQRSASLLRGVISGVGGVVFYSLINLLIQPAGAAAELIWQLATLAVLWFLIRSTIRRALSQDALAFGASGERVVCPACKRLTPDGVYCANCGADIHPAKPQVTVETSLPG